jgi:Undecaprenyl-phosphate galactose phosphotransferase WbaP
MRPKITSLLFTPTVAILKKIKYPLGLGMVAYIVYQIGWNHIVTALNHCTPKTFLLPLIPLFIASLLRIRKLNLLAKHRKDGTNLQIFLASRFGCIMNGFGYFLPVCLTDLHKLETLNILIVDKIIEILSTLFLGSLASFWLFSVERQKIYLPIAVVLFSLSGILGILIRCDFPLSAGQKSGLSRLLNHLAQYRTTFKKHPGLSLHFYLLTLIATSCDFLFVWLIFKMLALPIAYPVVPVIWATSGIIGFLTLLPAGPTEYSVVFLYRLLANVRPADTAVTIILSKIIMLLNLLIFLGWHLFPKRVGLKPENSAHAWQKPVILVGTSQAVDLLARSIATETHTIYRIVGIIQEEGSRLSGNIFPVLGDFEALEETITAHRVKEVFIAQSGLSREKSLDLINRIRPLVHHVSVMPDLFDIPVENIKLETLPTKKVVFLKIMNKLANRWNLLYKRSFDIFCGFFLLFLITPLMLLIIIMVKLDSPGPVFYIDKRIGRNKREFRCYKFRTMQMNNEEILNHFLLTNLEARNEWHRFAKLKTYDPRLTRLGRTLRRFSLDELPQLFNVLKGEMSLVGPRPYLPRERDRMGRFIHTITETTPGITGLWQVSGRNELDFQERLSMDSWYVRNWSFRLDLVLLVNTFKILIEGRGAY